MKYFVEYTVYRTEEDTIEVTRCKGNPPSFSGNGILCKQTWEWSAELEDEIWILTSWKAVIDAECKAQAIRKGMIIIDPEISAMGYR